MNIQRGMRDKLEKYMNPNQSIDVYMDVLAARCMTISCFGVDASGNSLMTDIWFSQSNFVPSREIMYSPNGSGAKVCFKLERSSQHHCKLVFTVSIDGSGTMGNISHHSVRIQQGLSESIALDLSGSDFPPRKSHHLY